MISTAGGDCNARIRFFAADERYNRWSTTTTTTSSSSSSSVPIFFRLSLLHRRCSNRIAQYAAAKAGFPADFTENGRIAIRGGKRQTGTGGGDDPPRWIIPVKTEKMMKDVSRGIGIAEAILFARIIKRTGRMSAR